MFVGLKLLFSPVSYLMYLSLQLYGGWQRLSGYFHSFLFNWGHGYAVSLVSRLLGSVSKWERGVSDKLWALCWSHHFQLSSPHYLSSSFYWPVATSQPRQTVKLVEIITGQLLMSTSLLSAWKYEERAQAPGRHHCTCRSLGVASLTWERRSHYNFYI